VWCGQCRHLTTHELGKHAGVSSVEAAGYSTLALGCSDGHLRLWDVRQWALLPVGPSPGGMSLQGHAKDVIRVSAVTQAEASGTRSAGMHMHRIGDRGLSDFSGAE
jgi:WD40 repeat protein